MEIIAIAVSFCLWVAVIREAWQQRNDWGDRSEDLEDAEEEETERCCG